MFSAFSWRNRNASQLSAEASAFEVEAYKQVCEDFRQLNQTFWQAPVIIISITGGIGFALVTVDNSWLRLGLLMFSFVCNISWLVIILRLRHGVMARLLARKLALEEKYLPPADGDPSAKRVMTVFLFLLGFVALASLAAIPFRDQIFAKADSAKLATGDPRTNCAPAPSPKDPPKKSLKKARKRYRA